MAHEEIYRELAECLASGEFVAYHKWGDDPSIFLVGVVRELTSTQAVFRDVDSKGVFEGDPHPVPLRLIHTLDRATRYLSRLRLLHDLGPLTVEERDVRKREEIRTLLKEAAENRAIVCLWTSASDKEDVLVLAVNEETVAVQKVFDAFPEDGRSMIRLKRIVRVRWGRSEADDTRVHRLLSS